MEPTEYKQYQLNALDICNKLEKELGKLPEFLQKKKHNIENNKFLLAIIGEVKAGKSTFINALLGEKILPSDNLQATSAIIEIFKSNKKFLRVLYANGTEIDIEDDLSTPEIDEAVEYLKELGSVSEEFRDLPIVQLNNFLKDNYDDQTGISEYDQSEFIELYENIENIHNLPEEIFRDKVTHYLEVNKTLSKIHSKLSFAFPLEYEFDAFTIVDTPGVNARGGIEKETIDFLDSADAIFYVHNINPIESKSLHSFVENTLPNRNRETLMLALTHISDHTTEAKNRFLDEAKKIYNKIKPSQIFAVDSLSELYRKDFFDKTMEEIEGVLDENEVLDNLFGKHHRKAKGNKNDFMLRLENQSNFNALKNEVQSLSDKAVSLQIEDFINDIFRQFEVVNNSITTELSDYKTKHENPQKFSNIKISIQEEIEDLKADYKKFTNKLARDFNLDDLNNDYAKIFSKLFEEFTSEINGKTFDSSETKNTIVNFGQKIVKDFDYKLNDFSKSLKSDLYEIVQQKDISLSEEYSISIPKIGIDEIWHNAKITATETKETKEKGILGFAKRIIFFGHRGYTKIKSFNVDKFWEKSKSDLIGKLGTLKQNVKNQINENINLFCEGYKKKTDSSLNKRSKRLQELEKRILNNGEIERIIEELENKNLDVEAYIDKCKQIKCNL